MCHVCFCEGCKFTASDAMKISPDSARLPRTLTELSLNFCRGEIGDASRFHIFLVFQNGAASSCGLSIELLP